MKTVKQILLFIQLLLAVGSSAQSTVSVGGQVTSTETGLPVPGAEVSAGLIAGQALFSVFTSENGFYQITFPSAMFDSAVIMTVWTYDCNASLQSHPFVVDPEIFFIVDFTICTNANLCQAAFSFIYEPANTLMLNFINQSFPANEATRWIWDFGDGVSSAEFGPVHEYPVAGVYTVCLTMIDSAQGCTSSSCLEIVAGEDPWGCQAFFGFDSQGLTTQFYNMSTGNADQFFWDFGDGTASQEANPQHTWAYPGSYPVCLSIFDSSTQCSDTYCETITTGDTLPDCHADFSYVLLEGNTIAFYNLSTGFLDDVIWDFGDGTQTSHEYEPVHTFPQAGIYQVCLAVISNFSNCQDVMCLEIMVGDTVSECHASFSFVVDSVPGNINHYQFFDTSLGTNISSWYWDMGDGYHSWMRNPEHTYAESGTYQVCLTVSGSGNGGYCSDTYCLTITTPSYYNLGGQVFAGNFPINNPENTGDTAVVRLYRKTGNQLSEVASGNFFEYGYYFFLQVLEGSYVVHAELSPGSSGYQDYIPGYTGETRRWQQAQAISLFNGDLFEAHVKMPEMSVTETGPGVIEGSIVCLDNAPFNPADKIVFLSRDGNIKAYTHTSADGAFTFSGLPLDTYQLSAEIAGIYSSSIEVSLSEFFSQVFGNLIEVSHSPVYGLDTPSSKNAGALGIWPNPATDVLKLSFSKREPEYLLTEIYTSLGNLCYHEKSWSSGGDNTSELNIGNLSKGIYLIVLRSADGTALFSGRFAKI